MAISTRKSNRKQNERLYGPMYRRLDGCDMDAYWYCGQDRQTLDYAPPIGALIRFDVEDFVKLGNRLSLVPCCLDCSADLSKTHFHLTPVDRLLFLQEKYSKLIQKYHSAWTDEEISELGRGIKQMVIDRKNAVKHLGKRLRRIENKIVRIGEENYRA